MAHDVFISYATDDKPIADGVCATLEGRSIRCWVAPRDVMPGRPWAQAIADAMKESRVMVLVFSQHANESDQIGREVNLAASRAVPIIPFRIEDVEPSGSLEYFIGGAHWLDALTPEMEKDLERLADTVRRLVPEEDGSEGERAARRRAALLEQYRGAVEVAWADHHLDTAEAAHLTGLATRLELTPQEKETAERDVLGGSVEEILVRERARSRPASRVRREQRDPESHAARSSFCRKCGAKTVNSAKFCRQCGAALTT